MPNMQKYDIREEKGALRREYRAKRRALPSDVKSARDYEICTRLLSTATYRYADILLAYAPLADEIDIMPIVRRAFADRKIVAFPLCDTKTSHMTFCTVKSEDELCVGAYGIREPRVDAPLYRYDEKDGAAVCLVPGLLFDAKGFRLGYGKGYYDRYLPSFGGVTVGLVYSDFLLPRVPRGRFDLAMDVIVTEKEVYANCEAY